jgi:hypothetical protein
VWAVSVRLGGKESWLQRRMPLLSRFLRVYWFLKAASVQKSNTSDQDSCVSQGKDHHFPFSVKKPTEKQQKIHKIITSSQTKPKNPKNRASPFDLPTYVHSTISFGF